MEMEAPFDGLLLIAIFLYPTLSKIDRPRFFAVVLHLNQWRIQGSGPGGLGLPLFFD